MCDTDESRNSTQPFKENDLLEQLGEIDPEAVQQYIDKKKIDRVQERMQLKI